MKEYLNHSTTEKMYTKSYFLIKSHQKENCNIVGCIKIFIFLLLSKNFKKCD